MEPKCNDDHNAKTQILIQPNIGLDSETRHSVVGILNQALANEVVLSVKTRGAYWNLSGAPFFELQSLFRSHHQQLNDICDDVVERIRMLGGLAPGSLQGFLNHTQIKEQPTGNPDIMHLIADHEAVIRFLREDARKCSEEYEDEGTFALLVDIIRLHEKMAWMLRAYFEHESIQHERQKIILQEGLTTRS